MPKVYNKYHKDAPKGAVYVGRPTKWGNPFEIGVHGDREKVIQLFRVVAEHVMVPFLEQDRTLSVAFPTEEANNWKLTFDRDDILELRGKDLVCFCAPKPCHADVLLELANAT